MATRDWRSAAACRGIADPDVFFPVAEDGPTYEAQVTIAKAICAGCVVRRECLGYALVRIPDGIAGGLSADERRAHRAAAAHRSDHDRSDVAVLAAGLQRGARRAEVRAAGQVLLAAGGSIGEVASRCGVSVRTAQRWARSTPDATEPAGGAAGESSGDGRAVPRATQRRWPRARASGGVRRSAMTSRRVLFVLLAIVAAAAAVLSFAALRDLARVCGFAAELAWLLPVVVDAGAAAGSLVWLGGRVTRPARRFARALALGLLALSVAANALGHGLEAFRLAPAWWVVVIVSAIAPSVLGAVVHLAVLVGRDRPDPGVTDEPIDYALTRDAYEAGLLDDDGLSHRWDDAPPVPDPPPDRAAELIAAGVGRRRLARELEITEYEARQLIERTRPAPPDTERHEPAGAPILNGVPS